KREVQIPRERLAIVVGADRDGRHRDFEDGQGLFAPRRGRDPVVLPAGMIGLRGRRPPVKREDVVVPRSPRNRRRVDAEAQGVERAHRARGVPRLADPDRFERQSRAANRPKCTHDLLASCGFITNREITLVARWIYSLLVEMWMPPELVPPGR